MAPEERRELGALRRVVHAMQGHCPDKQGRRPVVADRIVGHEAHRVVQDGQSGGTVSGSKQDFSPAVPVMSIAQILRGRASSEAAGSDTSYE